MYSMALDNLTESRPTGLYWLVKVSIATLLIVSIALPSGTLLGVPIKHMAYITCLLSLAGLWVRESARFERWLLLLAVYVTAFITFFVLVGLFRGLAAPGSVIKEATGVFTAVTIVLLVLAAKSQRCLSNTDIIRYTFYGAYIFAFWKSMIVFSLVLGVFSYDQISAFFTEQAGYRLVSSGIYGGWVRINLIIYDFIVAMMLFVVPTYRSAFDKVPRVLLFLFFPIGLACLVFAFSRLLFGVVLLLWLFSFVFRFKFVTKLIWAATAAILITAAAPWIAGAVEQRFNSTGSAQSDDIREEQIDALLNTWSKVPLIGGGFGYYSREMVRDWRMPFNYEVQWIGFLVKFGALGILAVTFLVFALYFEVLKGPRTLDHYVLAFTLSCFILGGFTNQYLVSSGSGVFYSLHIALAQFFRNKHIAERQAKSVT